MKDWTKCPNILIDKLTGSQLKVFLLMASVDYDITVKQMSEYMPRRSIHRELKFFKDDDSFVDAPKRSRDMTGNFTMVPNYAIKSIKGNELLVYAYICNKITIPNYDFSAKRISKSIKLGVRGVQCAINSLIDKEYMHRDRLSNRRVKYILLDLPEEFKKSIFDKAKGSEYKATESAYLFQMYILSHDSRYCSGDAHKQLTDSVITDKIDVLFELYDGSVPHGDYISYINRFLDSDTGDSHFPLFVEYLAGIKNPALLFDSSGYRTTLLNGS